MSRQERRAEIRHLYTKYRKNHCEDCGFKNYKIVNGHRIRDTRLTSILTVHHIDQDIKNNIPENLMTLCRTCHDKVDNQERKPRLLYWRRNEKGLLEPVYR